MKVFNRIKAFSLVELIVVIVILAILAVIAVMTMSNRIIKSRDSRRKTDVQSISNGLNIYIAEHSIFPDPDVPFIVKDKTGAIAWYQGEFGNGIINKIQGFNKNPKDPNGLYYGYSITADKKKFQVKSYLELQESISLLGDSLYAAISKYPIIKGKYDGWLVTHTGAGVSEYYMLWKVPNLFIEESKLITGYRFMSGNQSILQNGIDNSINYYVKQLSITSLFDSDIDNDGLTISNIKSTFTGYDGNTFDTTVAKSIVSSLAVSTSISSVSYLNCTGTSYSGYVLTGLDHGITKLVTKIITNGTGSMNITCNNGIYSYGDQTITCQLGYHLSGSTCSLLTPELVKDIRTGTSSSSYMYLPMQIYMPISSSSYMINIGGILYFVANDGTHGRELRRSDGTDTGTYIVKDIYIGSNDSNISQLTNINGILYFSATDGTNGSELWKSDGTTAGTMLVKNINSGSSDSNPNMFLNINGVVYFSATDGTNGSELWKTDGTTVGTTLVKDINTNLSDGSNPSNLTNLNGVLYFAATTSTSGKELWKSDGTTAGTILVKDINSGSAGSYPTYITNINNILYFSANDGTHGAELWKSDGTTLGTVLVKDIIAGSSDSYPYNYININGNIVFLIYSYPNVFELWKSDGTTAGTTILKNLNVGGASQSLQIELVEMNGNVYFKANDNINGYELWKSDGTTAGTILVKDINSGSAGSYPTNLVNINGVLYFIAGICSQSYRTNTYYDCNNAPGTRTNLGLWRSDGTSAGTYKVSNNLIPYFVNVNGKIMYNAVYSTYGDELLKIIP